MTGIFGRKLREKLSPIFADCDMSKFRVDLSTATASLTDVRLADGILQIISEELSCHVPLVATAITVGRATVSLGLFQFSLEAPRLELDNVEVRLRTKPAALWDATAAKRNFQTAKLRAARFHSRVVRLSHEEGDGFMHSVVAQVLEKLEICIRGMHLSVFDDSSLRIGSLGKSFTMGAGFAQAELLRADGDRRQSSIFRRLSIQEPSAYVDMVSLTGAEKVDKLREPDMASEISVAMESKPGREQDANEASTEDAPGLALPPTSLPRDAAGQPPAYERDWLLTPSGEARFELGFLQCWQPTMAKLRPPAGAPAANNEEPSQAGVQTSVFRWAAGSWTDDRSNTGAAATRHKSLPNEPLVSEADIAELGIPMHGKGSIKEMHRLAAELYLPRSAAFVGLQSVRLRVTPRHVEALLAFVAFAVLGYGAVLQGVLSGGGVPGDEEVTDYCANWLKSIVDGAVNPAVQEALKKFESAYSLRTIMTARNRALDSLSLGGGGGGSKDGTATAEHAASSGLFGVVWRSFTSAGASKCCNTENCQQQPDRGGIADGTGPSPRLMSTSILGNQLENWEDIVRVMRTALENKHPGWRSRHEELANSDCAVFLAGMRCRQVLVDFVIQGLWQQSSDEELRLSIEEIAFSAGIKRQLDIMTQMSMSGFRVIDDFGPAELRRLRRKMQRPMIMPTARTLVWTGDAESELYVFFGSKASTHDPQEPSLSLRMMSFGTLNICLPTTQLLVLCLNLLPADVRFMLGRCFAGAPWRSRAPMDVVREAERGKEVARSIWGKSSPGQIESCHLQIDMEPVHVTLPYPNRDAHQHTKFEDADEWREAVKICLGAVHAASWLRPRAPLPSEFRVRASSAPQISKAIQLEGELFDEYRAQLEGVTAEWYDTNEPGKRRQLVAPMSAKVSLFICHWTRASLPQGKVFYDVANMVWELEPLDHEAVIAAMHELFCVGADIARRAAARALGLVERRMRELAKASPMRRGLRKRNAASAPGGTEAVVTCLDDTKLWDVIVRIEHFKVQTRLPSQTSTEQPRLELLITGQELIFFTFVDGSISGSFSAQAISFGDPGKKAWNLYQSAPAGLVRANTQDWRGTITPRHLHTHGRHADHLRLSMELLVPDNWDWEWQLAVDVLVRQPVVAVDWETLPKLVFAFLSSAKHCGSYSGFAAEPPINTSVEGEELLSRANSAVDDEYAGGFYGEASQPTAMSLLPDRVHFFLQLESAELIVPTLNQPGNAIDVCPALRARGSLMVEVRDFKAHRRQHYAELKALPELKLNSHWRDVAMGFHHVTSIQDLRRGARFTLCEHLEPCRGHFSIRHDPRQKATVELHLEPMRIHIVPPTRRLFQDILGTAEGVLEGLGDQLGVNFETGIECIDCALRQLFPQDADLASEVQSNLDPAEVSKLGAGGLGESPRRSLSSVRNISGKLQARSGSGVSNTEAGFEIRDVLSKESAVYANGGSSRNMNPFSVRRGRSQASDNKSEVASGGYARRHSFRSSGTAESIQFRAHALSVTPSVETSDVAPSSIYQGPFPAYSNSGSNTSTHTSIMERDPFVGPLQLPLAIVLTLKIENLSMCVGEMPGSGQNLHAEAVLEDFRLEFEYAGSSSEIDAIWKTTMRTMMRFDAFDALSRQVEPVVEPVQVAWRLSFSSMERVPVGGATVSWVNFNLPLGVFYAARLWLRAEQACQYTPETPAHATSVDATPAKLLSADEDASFDNLQLYDADGWSEASTYSLRHWATHNQSMVGVVDMHAENIVNMTGEPLAVRLLDDPSTETRGTSWFTVRSYDRFGAEKQRTEHGAAATWTVGVPRLALRGAIGNKLFEVVLQSALQLAQFEVVHLRNPVTGCSMSLLLRAVPLESGRGCCLHVCTSVMVKNNTPLELVWTTPRPRSAAGVLDSVDEEETLAPPQAQHQTGVQVRWLDPDTFGLISHVSSGSNEICIAPARAMRRRIQPFRRIPLPISWALAAHEPGRHNELQVLADDSAHATGVQPLPSRTLQRLGTFDFSQPHREEEKRLKLGGSLVRLTDRDGKPCHLCCSLTVGLLADKAVCLEIVISSCFTVINELPMPLDVEGIEFGNQTMATTRIEPGSSSKQYIAAEELIVDFEVPGGMVTSKVPVNGASAFWTHVDTADNTVQVIATPKTQTKFQKSDSFDSQESTISDFINSSDRKGGHDLASVISLCVLFSSAFDSDSALQRLHTEDMGLEMLTSFKPPEWKTYRRALTVYSRYWVENRSSVDIWLRPKGRRSKGGKRSLFRVSRDERRLLPAHLERASAMKVCVTPDFTKSRNAIFKLRGIKHTRGVLLECEQGGDVPTDEGRRGTVCLQAVVVMAPMHFRGTKVIQLYDNLLVANATDLPITASTQGAELYDHAKAVLRRQASTLTAGALPKSVSQHSINLEDGHGDSGLVKLVKPGDIVPIDSAGRTLNFCFAHLATGDASMSRHMEQHTTNFTNWASDFVMSKYLRHGFIVHLDKPSSFKVRLRTQPVEDGTSFQNFQVSVKRAKQDVGTIVLVEPCTQPRFLVHNSLGVPAEISQRGVNGAKEVLQSKETLEFVWYEPMGTHELVVKKHEIMADRKAMRRLSTDIFTREVAHLAIQRSFSQSTGHEVLNIVYADTGPSPVMFNTMTTISLSSVDVACRLRAEGFGLTLSDAASTQVLYGVADRFTVSVMASRVSAKVRHRHQPDWMHDSKGSVLNLPLGLGTFKVAPMDICVQLHNVQVDSHIPGSFFSCMVRPLRGRSHLWRSFDALHPIALKNKRKVYEARGPVLQADFWECRFFGSTMLVSNMCAELDRFVVNVDEALLVGVGAYYCRLATYFSLPPFREEHQSQQAQLLDGVGCRIMSGSFGALAHAKKADNHPAKLIVEDLMEIRQLTAYISLRLVESANPYVEALQADELVSIVLRMFTHFYSAALLQPAMLQANSRPFRQPQVYMTVNELAQLLHDYIIAPLEKRIVLFLFFSFDWLGNPLHLLMGMVAGIRELARQPYNRGLIGLPLGIIVCVCSISGSILDTLARSMSSTVKLLNRLQRTLSSRIGLHRVQNYSFFALFRQPTSAVEGIRMGVLLATRHSNAIPLNIGLLLEWLVIQLRARWWLLPVLFVVSIAMLGLNLCLDVLQIILLLLHNILQGLCCHLYRRSAEDVCDLAPVQLFALELPLHLRPMRSARNFKASGSYTGLQFDFLTALASARLAEPEEKLMFNCFWVRDRDSDQHFEEGEEAIAAFWCGARQTGGGSAAILVDTGIHLALLQVTSWGDITPDGRPRRPKIHYNWLWRIHRSRISRLAVAHHNDNFELILELANQPDRRQVAASSPRQLAGRFARRVVRFPTKQIAMRAFEALSLTTTPSLRPNASVSVPYSRTGMLLVADGAMPGVIDEHSQ